MPKTSKMLTTLGRKRVARAEHVVAQRLGRAGEGDWRPSKHSKQAKKPKRNR